MKSGLLSCSFGLVFNKVNITDPELTVSSGFYVYLWIGGMDIKGYFIPQLCVKFLHPRVAFVKFVKALSFKVV